jgi:hypothetical protein
MRKKRNVYRLLVGEQQGKRLLERPRSRWADKIKRDLVEIGFGEFDWVGLAQGKEKWGDFLNEAMNIRFLRIAEKHSGSYTTDGLSSSTQLSKLS